MKITVERFVSDNDSTLSTVFVDGVFQCMMCLSIQKHGMVLRLEMGPESTTA